VVTRQLDNGLSRWTVRSLRSLLLNRPPSSRAPGEELHFFGDLVGDCELVAFALDVDRGRQTKVESGAKHTAGVGAELSAGKLGGKALEEFIHCHRSLLNEPGMAFCRRTGVPYRSLGSVTRCYPVLDYNDFDLRC
jgi:hypothetical protein